KPDRGAARALPDRGARQTTPGIRGSATCSSSGCPLALIYRGDECTCRDCACSPDAITIQPSLPPSLSTRSALAWNEVRSHFEHATGRARHARGPIESGIEIGHVNDEKAAELFLRFRIGA